MHVAKTNPAFMAIFNLEIEHALHHCRDKGIRKCGSSGLGGGSKEEQELCVFAAVRAQR